MKIVLIGNQNSGKTALFNILTNSNQKIGNWPGVTIERCEGKINNNNNYNVIDLPGIYSLAPYTNEERITYDFIFNNKENIDLIINVIDVTSLERSLYLTTQLLELNLNTLIVLNMYDLAIKRNIKININDLEKELNTTILPISARTNFNILQLKKIIIENKFIENKKNKKIFYPLNVKNIINKIININHFNNHKYFKAIETLEKKKINNKDVLTECEKIEQKYESDFEQLIATYRYDYIIKIKNKYIEIKNKENFLNKKLDNIFLNKYLAIPIFILIISIIYYFSIFIIGKNLGDKINFFFNEKIANFLTKYLLKINTSPWAISLVVNGIIKGISLVISFMPQLIILFFCLSFLETVGYMSRIALFFDYIFHKFGLSGKSIIPFIIGTGCSVPGVLNTRTIENEKERTTTIILVPFIPCNTKLMVISSFLLSNMVFIKKKILFFILIFIEAIFIIFLILFFLKKIFFKNEKDYSSYISELPEYKMPNLKYIFSDVKHKISTFIKHTGIIMLLFSIIIWFLISFTFTFQYVDGKNILLEKSILAKIGNFFSWFFYLILGGNLSWSASISAIQGLIAKEQIISSINVIGKESFNFFTPITAFAFLTFNLFSIPCIGTLSAMYHELKSIKKLSLIILMEIMFAWIIASFIGIFSFFK